jgi:hypothetical protein
LGAKTVDKLQDSKSVDARKRLEEIKLPRTSIMGDKKVTVVCNR